MKEKYEEPDKDNTRLEVEGLSIWFSTPFLRSTIPWTVTASFSNDGTAPFPITVTTHIPSGVFVMLVVTPFCHSALSCSVLSLEMDAVTSIEKDGKT